MKHHYDPHEPIKLDRSFIVSLYEDLLYQTIETDGLQRDFNNALAQEYCRELYHAKPDTDSFFDPLK